MRKLIDRILRAGIKLSLLLTPMSLSISATNSSWSGSYPMPPSRRTTVNSLAPER